MKKFKKFQLSGKCVDISSEGKGIIKYNNKVIFVNGLFLDEEALIEVDYDRANVYYGHILKLTNISKDRIQPKCKVCTACGGCQFQQLSYGAQLKYKQKKVYESLKRIGNIETKINECIGMEDPYNYRNKIQVPFGYDEKKRIVCGFYKEKTHKIIPIEECYIEDKRASKILKVIKSLMNKYKLKPYDEDLRNGEIRHVLIRTSKKYNELMVVLVMACNTFPGRKNFIKDLIDECPEITTIIQNTNLRHTNVILGEKEEVLYGKGFINDELCGLKFKISPKSFYQINPVQCEKLYKTVIDSASLNKNEVVLDAYAGVGTIGICAAKYVKKVYSVEIVKEASKDAFINAKDNKIENVSFICKDATKYIQELVLSNEKIDVILMDPPRTGSTPNFLNSVLKLEPSKIIYVSCDPATLARDLKILVEKYNILSIQPVDMFPMTSHIETVCALSLKKSC